MLCGGRQLTRRRSGEMHPTSPHRWIQGYRSQRVVLHACDLYSSGENETTVKGWQPDDGTIWWETDTHKRIACIGSVSPLNICYIGGPY